MILYILIFGTFPNGSGQVQYHFEEDFSDIPSQEWNFETWEWNGIPGSQAYPISDIPHNWTFDGEMVSEGPENYSIVNVAYLNDTTIHGAWSLDVFVPSDSLFNEIWNTRFYISTWMNYDDWQAFKISSYGDNLRIEVHDSSPNRILDREAPALKFDIYQHYDLIRTPDEIFLFVDQELVIKAELASSFASEVNFFQIDTAQGSGIKFDNIRITSDYEGVCEELGCSEEPEPDTEEPEPDTEESTIKWFQIAIGGAVVAVIFSVYEYYRFKKKDLAN